MPNALKFKSANVPRQQGEQARLKVVQGPDYGSIYVLTSARATVGRGEENDVMISDLKASRRHAELTLGSGGWTMRDLGSSNGIFFHGKSVRASAIRSGETFSLGETTFEFLASDAGTMMLVAPPKSLVQLNAEQQAFAEQKKRVQNLGRIGGATQIGIAGPSAAQGGGLLKDKRVQLLLGVGIAAIFLLPDGEQSPARKASKKDPGRDLASYLPQAAVLDAPTSKAADMFFKDGFREFGAKNYLRAKTQFETVLQMAPGHPLATLYLENCNVAIDEAVKFHLERGKRGMTAGKLREARGHYETVLRTLFRDQSNPAYAEAKDQLNKVNKLIRGEDN